MTSPLSTRLDDPDALPYFLWSEPVTEAEFRQRLTKSSPEEQDRWLSVLLREARDTDVWRFTTPREVVRRWDAISPRLGRRRAFWAFLLARWREEGLLDD